MRTGEKLDRAVHHDNCVLQVSKKGRKKISTYSTECQRPIGTISGPDKDVKSRSGRLSLVHNGFAHDEK